MGSVGKIAVGAVGLIAALAAVLGVRTALYEPPAASDYSDVSLAAAPVVDNDRAARHLSEAVRFKTISHQNSADNQPAEWDRLHLWLQQTYPAAHASMQRETVATHTLIYTWAGSDPARKAMILMAHQDVVPAGTESAWKHPPFDGTIADGAVWGRGSIDDKGSLIAIFEGIEALAAFGFRPARTVIVVSGHNEEDNQTGAREAAKTLKARNVEAEFVLDEGQIAIRKFPILPGSAALVGVAEKGYATLRVTAKGVGGHSSMPPPATAVEVLAKAVLAITENGDPLRFDGPGADTVRTLAPHASLLIRIAVANEWLFGPMLVDTISATPAGAALLHTTAAPTMLSASPKENVLPQEASAVINFRIMPGQTAEDVMARAKAAVDGIDVSLAWVGPTKNPSPVSATDSEAWRMIAALATEDGTMPVAPSLVVAATDSYEMMPVAKDIYRYQPLILSLDEIDMIHGSNEHMTLDNLARMTRFYARLIATAAR